MDWDLHTFGLFDANVSLVVESSSFPASDDTSSTGYLEDALVEWNNRGKRKWMHTCQQDTTSDDEHNIQDENILLQNILYLNHQDDLFASSAFELDNSATNSSWSIVGMSNVSSSSTEITKRQEVPLDSTPATHKRLAIEDMTRPAKRSTNWRDRPSCSGTETPTQLKRKVAYPFELVKPGGDEEDVTLEDINARILRRPTRPIRHPIGEFACHPYVLSAEGPGLSGKAVVALTRIQTQGRGTITIIRTRG